MTRMVYLDTSALVKRYVEEAGTPGVQALIGGADVLGTSVLTRVEMAAALSKAARMGFLTREEAEAALEAFLADWPRLYRLKATDLLLEWASNLAWEEGLRGCDATHLAAALLWQGMLEVPVITATFDRDLWMAAKRRGLEVWPDIL
ncbi:MULTISPECIES: type II toxin-antitoxin system VapC family toxin [unclassified Meiothermus]|uniref:type II toxin-antitoxin system VapC family toxin n=1 Tax=unclassified Meiothermus TaxID=370471 RepID=UPI000D7C7E97|nr:MULTISPECIES: type II toxin-antitoxin system VapC family toxin [unclassified Meiothermus]PZA06030.1 VapC toxin family PIN domain ribonuclease [Meiothermus sp. Pnk-1]RYM36174.1 PIN domain-containing protein [Meiothermus sp. PNK-Is4]